MLSKGNPLSPLAALQYEDVAYSPVPDLLSPGLDSQFSARAATLTGFDRQILVGCFHSTYPWLGGIAALTELTGGRIAAAQAPSPSA